MTEVLQDTAPVQTNPQVDYFGFSHVETHYLPDGITFVELQAMNEGDKAKFQKSTQRDMVLEKGSGNARFKMDPAAERHALLETSIKGWNFQRGGQPIPYTQASFRDFIRLADPEIIEKIELAIRKLNPWLLAELTVEEIDKQIDELKEMREVAEKRESGEGSSSNK